MSALRAHAKAPYKTDVYRKTLVALNRPGTARIEGAEGALEAAGAHSHNYGAYTRGRQLPALPNMSETSCECILNKLKGYKKKRY